MDIEIKLWCESCGIDHLQTADIESLIDGMQAGVEHFQYVKSDGSIRDAYGTLNHDIIKAHKPDAFSKQQSHRAFTGIVYYFDLETDDWRAFSLKRFNNWDSLYSQPPA